MIRTIEDFKNCYIDLSNKELNGEVTEEVFQRLDECLDDISGYDSYLSDFEKVIKYKEFIIELVPNYDDNGLIFTSSTSQIYEGQEVSVHDILGFDEEDSAHDIDVGNKSISEQLSNCCNAPVRVDSADEGTSCYICTKCDKPCDIAVEQEAKEEPTTNNLVICPEGTRYNKETGGCEIELKLKPRHTVSLFDDADTVAYIHLNDEEIHITKDNFNEIKEFLENGSKYPIGSHGWSCEMLIKDEKVAQDESGDSYLRLDKETGELIGKPKYEDERVLDRFSYKIYKEPTEEELSYITQSLDGTGYLISDGEDSITITKDNFQAIKEFLEGEKKTMSLREAIERKKSFIWGGRRYDYIHCNHNIEENPTSIPLELKWIINNLDTKVEIIKD